MTHKIGFYKLKNRHTYTYGILEGIGVCIGVHRHTYTYVILEGIGVWAPPSLKFNP